MRYILFICRNNSVAVEDGIDLEIQAWVAAMDNRGIRRAGERLRPTGDATTVRVRMGEVVLHDGSFAETQEQIAGFDLIECSNLDEAIEVASKHPVARTGLVEIRPYWEG